MRRVGVRDDDVGRHAGSPSASRTPLHPAAGGLDPTSRRCRSAVARRAPGTGPRPARRRAVRSPPRTYQAPKACSTYGTDGQRGRGAARVGAGVGGVAVEQQCARRGSREVAPAQPAQRPAGGDGAAGRGPAAPARARPRGPATGDSRNGSRVACQMRSGAAQRTRRQCRARRPAPSAASIRAVVSVQLGRGVEPRAVGEAVAGPAGRAAQVEDVDSQRVARWRRTARANTAAWSAATGRCRSGRRRLGCRASPAELAADHRRPARRRSPRARRRPSRAAAASPPTPAPTTTTRLTALGTRLRQARRGPSSAACRRGGRARSGGERGDGEHGQRVGERVRPDPAAGPAGGQHPAGHAGSVAGQPDARAAPARPAAGSDVGQAEQRRRPRRRRPASRRRPTATSCSRRAARPSAPYIRQVASARAVGDAAAAAGALDRPEQGDVVEDLAADGGVPAGPVGRRVDGEQLPVGRGQRRPRGERSASRSGRNVSHDHCSSGCTSRSAPPYGELARVAARPGRARAGAAGRRWRRGRAGASTTSASTKTQHAAARVARRRRAAGRRSGLPSQPAGRRPPSSSRTRGSPSRAARRRRCRRWSRRRAPRSSAAVQPSRASSGPQAGADAARASSRTGSSTAPARAGAAPAGSGPAQQRRFTAVWAAPASGEDRSARTRRAVHAGTGSRGGSAPRSERDGDQPMPQPAPRAPTPGRPKNTACGEHRGRVRPAATARTAPVVVRRGGRERAVQQQRSSAAATSSQPA